MKQRFALLMFSALVITSGAYAQKETKTERFASKTKGHLVGIHFTMSDFVAPLDFESFNSLRKIPWRDKSPGLSISYWKGLSPRVDFSTRFNTIFHDYASTNYANSVVNNEFGIELEPTINLRPITDDHFLSPFLTAGVGAGYYTEKFGAYVPMGLGLQANFKSIAYVFLQGQYKASLTEKAVKNNVYYSIGVAGNVGKEKEVKVAPLPVIPVKKDKDNDGIEDDQDACPDVAGIAALKGCPDADGDGIADAADKCPTVKGLAKYNGCPIPDTDGDGINDEQDKCPAVKGLVKYNGCPIPDTDGDGVNDEEDKCPNEAGVASNYGCPEIKKEVINKVNVAAKNIFFATGSAKLLSKSNASLNNVVAILKENPTYKVSVEGHTDNTGKAEKNQTLSEERAAAVKAYLISKGIDESRLSTAGFGQDKPIADNKTAAGRSQNRRVELNLTNY